MIPLYKMIVRFFVNISNKGIDVQWMCRLHCKYYLKNSSRHLHFCYIFFSWFSVKIHACNVNKIYILFKSVKGEESRCESSRHASSWMTWFLYFVLFLSYFHIFLGYVELSWTRIFFLQVADIVSCRISSLFNLIKDEREMWYGQV